MSPSLATASLRLRSMERDGQVVGYSLEAHTAPFAGASTGIGDDWRLMARCQPLARLVYRDGAGERHEVELAADSRQEGADSLELGGGFVDGDGVRWRQSVTIARTARENQLNLACRLETSAPRQVLYWSGPRLLAGEGSFGAAREEALFPGLEYLLDDEPSSDTRFAASKFAERSVPHPYQITIPMMAVSHEGCGVGLLWDPNQNWGSAWRHPAARFSSPNRHEGGPDNHLMALSVPGPYERWVAPGQTEAHTPVSVDPVNPLTLEARLAVAPGCGVFGILREWLETYGLPPLPAPQADWRENLELCVDAYLDVAWHEGDEAWHHTLRDNWQPRFEPLLANQLWRYSRWSGGDPLRRARARDQVERALPQAEAMRAPHNVPPLDLALVRGDVALTLDGMRNAARELMDEQQGDGSFGWTPAAVADVGTFKTEERLALMGEAQDSATGYTGGKVIPLLAWALASGDSDAVAASLRAADWCNTQRRPEGAQTWELHLHVPDVLAAPWLININVAAWRLSGDEGYLDQAERWAATGLPFTFLWNGYYRPIMRYGTVPVFGVTFHDVQSWFGVIVHWNGLWYGDALMRLAALRPGDGTLDWGHLAEGIARHGIQEQITFGPQRGFYPDAFSTVHGEEEYTWWLNPQLIGLNSFPRAGLPLANGQAVLRNASAATLHVTSGAQIAGSSLDDSGALEALLQDQPGQANYTLLAGAGRPSEVSADNAALPQVDDVEAVEQGWQWLESQGLAVVRLCPPSGAALLRARFGQK